MSINTCRRRRTVEFEQVKVAEWSDMGSMCCSLILGNLI